MTRPLFIFDYDGTLCDTLDAISSSLCATFAAFADTVPAQDEIARLIGTGKTLQETIHALRPASGPALDADALKRWVEHYRRCYAEHGEARVALFDGAHETLAALSRVGDLVLLSNKGIDAVETSLARFDIRRYFGLVLAEEPGQPKKPDPNVFTSRIAPNFPGVDAGRCVVIGDTAADLEFARNIGAPACFARYGFGEQAACEAVGYTHAIDALPMLVELYAPSRAVEDAMA